mmetsp:Transcript_36802/g.95296  ORF Transcript_36802/g.95296 Transcript_36802/m.95296 type:complete len:81 (+) Transcript_36802:211-453(+)
MESKFGALLDSLGRLLDIDKMSAKSFVKADDEIRKAYVDALQAKYHSREAEKKKEACSKANVSDGKVESNAWEDGWVTKW